MPFLIAVGAFLAALIGGIVLYAIGFEWLGIVIALASTMPSHSKPIA